MKFNTGLQEIAEVVLETEDDVEKSEKNFGLCD